MSVQAQTTPSLQSIREHAAGTACSLGRHALMHANMFSADAYVSMLSKQQQLLVPESLPSLLMRFS